MNEKLNPLQVAELRLAAAAVENARLRLTIAERDQAALWQGLGLKAGDTVDETGAVRRQET